MNVLDKYSQNEFLIRWVEGKLTSAESESFLNSKLYKNLVLCKKANHNLLKNKQC